jgi:uncharacterized protein YcbK (DUF882 family)
MSIIYKKGICVPVSKYFSSTDFDCHCLRPNCNETTIDSRLAVALDSLFDVAGPFRIDSGYRCPAHNKEIGGVFDSQHILGKAADCKSIDSKTGAEMARFAENVLAFHEGGIGTYPSFAHCDVRPYRARWTRVA